MNTIWKITVPVDDRWHTFSLPGGWNPVHVACQGQADHVEVWCLVTPDADSEVTVELRVYGTGHPIDVHHPEVVGTALAAGGALVWHVIRRIDWLKELHRG